MIGGHAILCHGFNVKGNYFKLHNSWGPNWGVNGECKISFEDMDKLLKQHGEAVIPTKRLR
jgi:C1A family cysteine protease